MSNLITERRKTLGLTQSDLAEALGCTKQAVSNYERNTRECNYITLRRLARLLGVTVAELLEDADDHDELQQRIQSSGLTYKQLEEQTGVPKSAIQRYASGTTEKIPVDRLRKLDAVLDTETPNDQEKGDKNMGGSNFKPDVTRNGLDVYMSKKSGVQERYSHRVMNYQLEKILALCDATGKRPSEVVNELLDFALARAVAKEITRVSLAFEEPNEEREEE